MTTALDGPRAHEAFPGLPPAPPGVVPYIVGYSLEEIVTPRLIVDPARGLGFKDETPHDRDTFGMPWVRPTVVPKARRGRALLKTVHPYRQRRAMKDMLCQVCKRPPADPGGPFLFIARNTAGPIQEGERTSSPPVCVPCAGIAVQLCRALEERQFTAAWVEHAPAWGVIGDTYDPRTLQPVGIRQRIEYGRPEAAWTVASWAMVELQGVTPADLDAEWAALGWDRLVEEFARVEELTAA